MALFGSKKNAAKKSETKALVLSSRAAGAGDIGRSIGVIRQPRITEKATFSIETNRVYVFEIAQTATKGAVKAAIQALYKVSPKDVHIARTPGKKVFVRGKHGRTPGVKKAYVYLKEGDTIELA